jgi:hypothetical protein
MDSRSNVAPDAVSGGWVLRFARLLSPRSALHRARRTEHEHHAAERSRNDDAEEQRLERPVVTEQIAGERRYAGPNRATQPRSPGGDRAWTSNRPPRAP